MNLKDKAFCQQAKRWKLEMTWGQTSDHTATEQPVLSLNLPATVRDIFYHALFKQQQMSQTNDKKQQQVLVLVLVQVADVSAHTDSMKSTKCQKWSPRKKPAAVREQQTSSSSSAQRSSQSCSATLNATQGLPPHTHTHTNHTQPAWVCVCVLPTPRHTLLTALNKNQFVIRKQLVLKQ